MNINPAAHRVLCFGDSNTWGYAPDTNHERYAANIRWPGVLQTMLGDSYEIIEEGLNSRRISSEDSRPGKEGRNAMSYILPCLDTHDPLDYVIIFLGTNDLKPDLGKTAANIADDLATLITTIQTRESQCIEGNHPKVLIVVPPTIDETTPYTSKGGKYAGANTKAIALKNEYKRVAAQTNSKLIDTQDALKTGGDGIHLTPESHKMLAEVLCAALKS